MSTYSFPSARTSDFQATVAETLDDVPDDEPVIRKMDAATNRVLTVVVREEESYAGEKEKGELVSATSPRSTAKLILVLRCLRFVGDANNDPIHTERQTIPDATWCAVTVKLRLENYYVGIPYFYGPSDIPLCSTSLLALLPVARKLTLPGLSLNRDYSIRPGKNANTNMTGHEVDDAQNDVAYASCIPSDGPSGARKLEESGRGSGLYDWYHLNNMNENYSGGRLYSFLWYLLGLRFVSKKSLTSPTISLRLNCEHTYRQALFHGLPEGTERCLKAPGMGGVWVWELTLVQYRDVYSKWARAAAVRAAESKNENPCVATKVQAGWIEGQRCGGEPDGT
ncbi:hypothetical protein EDD16DRAFT_1527177 [Pisolithus croceorrhizus]|nr:hypothetical protein EDD16DRAFT_1527177 [Pisolithus croceorrhizus]KAI6105308.1 hypothetical protein EV401DRAFT_1892902 [Pisolithus croceorrhizus]